MLKAEVIRGIATHGPAGDDVRFAFRTNLELTRDEADCVVNYIIFPLALPAVDAPASLPPWLPAARHTAIRTSRDNRRHCSGNDCRVQSSDYLSRKLLLVAAEPMNPQKKGVRPSRVVIGRQVHKHIAR